MILIVLKLLQPRSCVLFRLLLLFIAVPLVELAVLLKLSEIVGWKETLLLVIVTGVLGTWLARGQGVRTLRSIHQSLSVGQMPTDQLLDAALILMAGALLLTPGVLTDLWALLLLMPVSRAYFRRLLVRWFKSHVQVLRPPAADVHARQNDPMVVDSYVVNQRSEA